MKKIWNIFKTVLSWALIIFTLCVVLFTAITLRTVDARNRNIFGYRMMIVQSDSMAATDFEAGDLIFVKEVDPATLKEGDIIAFISRNSHNAGETVTHKIRSVTEDENGWTVFTTYGTSGNTDDEMPVRFSDVQGIYTGRIKDLGVFFAFLRTPKGYISFILLPMLLMIFVSLYNCIRMFSGAQKQAEQEHQAVVEEERRKTEQLQKEMDELRDMIRSIQAQAAPVQQKPDESAPEIPQQQESESAPEIPQQQESDSAPEIPQQQESESAPETPRQQESESAPEIPQQKEPEPVPEIPQQKEPEPVPEAPRQKAPVPAPEVPKRKAPASAPAVSRQKAPEPVKTPDPVKTSEKKVPADTTGRTARTKTDAFGKAAARTPRKEGRFVAAPDQKKNDIQLQRKPNVKRQKPAGYDELDLDNIMAEFRPRKK